MDTLNAALGKFYLKEHATSPPTFLQVIGWTNRAEAANTHRLYVYVRKVPIRLYHHFGGGSWEFDTDVIKTFSEEIVQPIRKNTHLLVTDRATIEVGAQALRYNGERIPIKNFIT